MVSARTLQAPPESGRAATITRSPRRAAMLADFGPAIALVLLCGVFAMLSPQFGTWANVRNMLDSAAVLAVITFGLTFVLMLGAIDLSIEGVMAASALCAALLV